MPAIENRHSCLDQLWSGGRHYRVGEVPRQLRRTLTVPEGCANPYFNRDRVFASSIASPTDQSQVQIGGLQQPISKLLMVEIDLIYKRCPQGSEATIFPSSSSVNAHMVSDRTLCGPLPTSGYTRSSARGILGLRTLARGGALPTRSTLTIR